MNKNNLRALLMPGIIGAVFVFVFIGIVGAALHNPKPQNLPIAIVVASSRNIMIMLRPGPLASGVMSVMLAVVLLALLRAVPN